MQVQWSDKGAAPGLGPEGPLEPFGIGQAVGTPLCLCPQMSVHANALKDTDIAISDDKIIVLVVQLNAAQLNDIRHPFERL